MWALRQSAESSLWAGGAEIGQRMKPTVTLFLNKMENEGLAPIVRDTFAHYYGKVTQGAQGLIPERDIEAIGPDQIDTLASAEEAEPATPRELAKAVIIVLNGGLGTSMGLTGTKSLLTVKDGKRFLDIILDQTQPSRVRLALMNSFNTHQETLAALKGVPEPWRPSCFMQNKYPKILQESLLPASWPENPHLEWNPPGHGDVYTALHLSGLLDSLLKQDVRYAFIANADNLGATLDPVLLGHFIRRQYPFMMEVSRRTASDKKGGHLARRLDGQLLLREAAQCPAEDMAQFQNIARYRYFNTNSLWVRLGALKDLIREYSILPLPMIVNSKTLDPRDPTSPPVFQVETAMGSAIELFDAAAAIQVPRQRFRPVKKCSDLLIVRSDCLVFDPSGALVRNPERTLSDMPEIDLDPHYYSLIDQFDRRIGKNPPSLVACEALNVTGNVWFGNKVVLRGRISIVGKGSDPCHIPDGSIIANDLMFN
jgi:UTP--glucose-1-phosphate uridylyltransferase